MLFTNKALAPRPQTQHSENVKLFGSPGRAGCYLKKIKEGGPSVGLGRFFHLHLLHGREGGVIIGHGVVGRGFAQSLEGGDLHHPGGPAFGAILPQLKIKV
jgi:hypothetical protein